MPARLPDEDLASVQAAPQTLATVAPTALGTNVAADELSHATSIAYRAAGIATRAQAALDQEAVKPALQQVAAQYEDNLGQLKAPYKGEPGLVERAAEQGTQIRIDARQKYLPGMTPGQMQQFNAGLADLANAHQAGALKIQTDYQEAARTGLQANQDAALYNTGWLPASQQIKVASQGVIANLDKFANPGQEFASQATKISQAGFEQFVQANNLSPQQSAFYKLQWDHDLQQELTQGAGRIGDAVTHYQEGLVTTSAMQGINGVIGGFGANPETYLPSMVKGGDFDKAVTALPAELRTPDMMLKLREEAASGALQGLEAQQRWDEAGDLLKNKQVRADLGDKVASWEAELAAHGPGAVDQATRALTWTAPNTGTLDKDVTSWVVNGKGLVENTPATIAQMQRDGVKPEQIADWERRTGLAQGVFKLDGNRPMSDMTLQELQHAAVAPPPSQIGAPDFDIRMMRAQMAQQELAGIRDDPGGHLEGTGKGPASTLARGKGQPISQTGDIGPRLTAERTAVMGVFGGDPAHPVGPLPDAGKVYERDAITQAWGEGYRDEGLAILPKASVDWVVGRIKSATPDTLYQRVKETSDFVQSFSPEISVGTEGQKVSPRAIVLRQLQAGGLKPGYSAMIAYAPDVPGGQAAMGTYTAAASNPENWKELPAKDAGDLKKQVDASLAGFIASNSGPADAPLNSALTDAVYVMARQLRLENPSIKNWKDAAAQASAWITRPYVFGDKPDQHVRIDAGLASQTVYPSNFPLFAGAAAAAGFGQVPGVVPTGRPGLAAPGTDSPVGGPRVVTTQPWWERSPVDMIGQQIAAGRPIDGATAVSRGLDYLKAWGVKAGGANLAMPPGRGLTPKDWESMLWAGAAWRQTGDGKGFELDMYGPDHQPQTLLDKFNRPIRVTQDEALEIGRTGHSKFETPPSKTQAPTTPEGHPLNVVSPPAAAAAIAGAHAAHVTGAQAAPAAAKPSAAEGAPAAAPGGGAPSAADYGQPAAGTVGEPAAAAPSGALNATQRALKQSGASDAVIAMFKDYGSPAPEGPGVADAPGTSPLGPGAFAGLNVTPNQAVKVLGPVIERLESRGLSGQVSPAGALGLMQIMPDTVREWASRLHMPVDLHAARYNDAYNVAIGTAILNHLTQHYMTGAVPMAGIALAAAAYNAGQGRLEGWHDKSGQHHEGWLHTIGDPRSGNIDIWQWASRIPNAETRGYVENVLRMTTRRLAVVNGAGPAIGGPGG